jgi:multidrug efflux pump subunit AcrB
MGFWKNMTNEFGKKTGKAIGNKLYGAHADDKRVGINRGRSDDSGLKVQVELKKAEIENSQFKANLERETIEFEKNQKLLDNVLNIEFDPTNKDSIIRSLTTLSTYIDLWVKGGEYDTHLDAALSKYDSGLALLNAIDPSNPMNIYFLQKKRERIQKEKKNNVGMWIFMGIILVFLIIMSFVFGNS